VWRGLHESMQDTVPGAKWTCAVHVGPRTDEGLSLEDLKAARASGLVRITTGLESGSQSLLDAMHKGTQLERTEEFLAAAREADLSTRLTVFTGYPGEDSEQVDRTATFLAANSGRIDRIHLSRLSVQEGTPLEAMVRAGDPSVSDLSVQDLDPTSGAIEHVNRAVSSRSYRLAFYRLLRVVHGINRRPLPPFAHELEGAM
jgi:anaerobic magnesium-protoporphyrin IX monomethyl ester cyclase